MEIRNLTSFLRIAEIGNFTKAADDLGYAQSTVTAQIQQLEKEIGKPLFERIGKKVLLTDAGVRLIEYANQIINIENEIRANVIAAEKTVQGSIRIGTVESVLNSFFVPVINSFAQKYPEVHIEIVSGISVRLSEMLRRNDIDIAVTIGVPGNNKDYILAASHPEEAIFAVSPDHPLSSAASISVQELLPYQIIYNGENTFLQQELYRLSMRYSIPLSGRIQSESSLMNIAMAVNNLGVAFAAEYLLRDYIDNGHLKPLSIKDYSLPFSLNVLYHRNKWITPAMRGFISELDNYWSL